MVDCANGRVEFLPALLGNAAMKMPLLIAFASVLVLCDGAALASGRMQDPKAEMVVTDARKELAAVEELAAKLAPGDVTAANRCLKRLEAVARKLGSARNRSHPDWVDAKSRYDALTKRITESAKAAPVVTGADPAAVSDLDSEVRKAGSELRQVALADMADAKVVQAWRTRIAELKKRHGVLAQDDRNVVRLGGEIDRLERTLNGGIEQHATHAKGQALGNQLQEMMDFYQEKNLPPNLTRPVNSETIGPWTKSMREILDVGIPRDLKLTEELAKDPAVNKQDIERARHWIGFDGKRRLEERLVHARSAVDGDLQEGVRYAEFLLAIDGSDTDRVQNAFLGEGRFDDALGRIEDGLRAVKAAEGYYGGDPQEQAPDFAAARAKIEKAREHVRVVAAKTLAEVRVPAARSKDAKLLAIAEETLKVKSYGVGEWKRMVIHYDVKKKEKYESTISPGTVRSTITTYHYVWEEFGVTTVEKVGEDYYLFVNKLKFYHSSDSVTPSGRWILSERFQSTRILPENFDK